MSEPQDIDAISDREYRSLLNRFLDDETEKDRQFESAEKRARFTMQEGGEFDPWTFEHVEEAITNAPKFERLMLWGAIARARKAGFNNIAENHFALSILEDMVEEYWHNLALRNVEKYIQTQGDA